MNVKSNLELLRKREIPPELKVDPIRICKEIEELIKTTVDKLNREGAVIGLSGGLDSAVAAVLTIRSLGPEKVRLLNMPERDSKRVHRKHAKKLAKNFGVPIITKRLTSILRKTGTYKLLPLRFIPTKKLRSWIIKWSKKKVLKKEGEGLLVNRFKEKTNKWIVKGQAYAYAKHRVRMVVLYQYAEVRNLMVVGAANKTEWKTGSYSKWGVDHCADIMPLIHLYRSQIEQLGKYLGLPEYILNKNADPDIMPGINDKEGLLKGFKRTDQILFRMENGFEKEKLKQEFGEQNVEQIIELNQYSKHMRESPYHQQMETI
jgi:NAD+ synthase